MVNIEWLDSWRSGFSGFIGHQFIKLFIHAIVDGFDHIHLDKLGSDIFETCAAMAIFDDAMLELTLVVKCVSSSVE
jgi:hypothetical protein